MNSKTGNNVHQKWCDLLTAVFTLCGLDSRLESRTVDRIISESRVRAARRIAALKPNRRRTVDLDALGHVIYHWQRTTRYLDAEGQPLRIAARGPAPSIEALFREIGRSDYFKAGLMHLKRVGRIKRARNGRYFPISEVSIVPSLTPEIAELVAQTVNRLTSDSGAQHILEGPEVLFGSLNEILRCQIFRFVKSRRSSCSRANRVRC